MDSLTRSEAQERAGLLSHVEYDVRLDLTTSVTDQESFESETTARFHCRAPGASTFIDLLASAVRSAVLNGENLSLDAFTGTRICLANLQEVNELRVVATCRYQNTGMGMHRFRDPVDGNVYLYTQFESFAAHQVYPCFDQPDLKGTFTFSVRVPETFEVVSNTPVTSKTQESVCVWTFAKTPLLSPYVTAIVAGPYYQVRDQYQNVELSLYCRQSLAPYLESDELFAITKQGLAFFEARFGYPYPFETYAQSFVPEFRFGAMENVACVTFADTYFLFRSKVTERRRQDRALTILHEMAHMWFGDLVTMRWWDDLWLNESFATLMGYFALAGGTRFTNAWVSFAAGEKAWAYRQDQLPTTHPITADIPDTESVDLYFDGISYAKGAAVLRQLVARVGETAFFHGVQTYFRRYAYGNADLAGFLASFEEIPADDLARWAREWLETAGVNTLHVEFTAIDAGELNATPAPIERISGQRRFAAVQVRQEAPQNWPTLRSHRLAIGLYDTAPEGLVRRRQVELDLNGASTAVPALVGEPTPALVLPNDGDLTYAKIRLDADSLTTITHRLKEIGDDLARALCWSATWEAIRDAELATRDFVPIVLNNISGESDIGIAERLLSQARSAILVYGDPANRDNALASLADAALASLDAAVPASDRQLVWARTFIAAARRGQHVEILRDLLDRNLRFEGLAVDTDLRWQIVRALTAVGADGEEFIDAELRRDPTDEGQRHAATARAAMPTALAKARAWATVVDDPQVKLATARAIMGGFQRHEQASLLSPYVGRYFTTLGRAWQEHGPEFGLTFAEQMYPRVVADETVVRATDEYLAGDAVVPPIRRLLLEGKDDVLRILQARGCDTARGLVR